MPALLQFTYLITSEAVTRDKVVHALPSRWRLKVVSPVPRGPRASPAQLGGGGAARARGIVRRPDAWRSSRPNPDGVGVGSHFLTSTEVYTPSA